MNRLSWIALAAAAALALMPAALGALDGSGNVSDIVQLTTSTGTLSVLSSSASGGSASGSPVTSGSSAFALTNSGSNVDTFVRYAWGTTPYYGASSSSTSISIRSTTHYISDLLWFKQQKVAADTTLTTSEYFSPLVIKNAASVQTATFSSLGNACTAWGSVPASFSPAAAGTFTVKYYSASSQTNDAPTPSDTFHYCLDTTNSQVYLGTSASFASGTRVYSYATNSANAVLNNYQWQLLNSGQTNGNFYCLTSYTGTGTSATPDLSQCQKLAYETLASTSIKLYVLQDPPAYFPSVNQAGTITYAVAGTQWNPYSQSTTNSA